ncbi:MAG TPA: sugar phosphate isomerase/epimerase family protein [Acidobacteriaceae bacterium]
MLVSRRRFLEGLAAASAVASLPFSAGANVKRDSGTGTDPHGVPASCPFRLAVINDEISQDFDHACSVAAHDFGLHWIELRGMWGKNITDLNAQEIAEAQGILKKYQLRVTDIASPLFKVDWPGAPRKDGQKRDQFNAHDTFAQQDALLDHCIALTRAFGTDRVRCFDFWRVEDVAPYREAINAKLRQAAERCARANVILVLENEMDCNTGTAEEAATTLAAVPNKNFMLNWDPGNAGAFPGAVPYPNGWNLLPHERIGHCHVKNVQRNDAAETRPALGRPMPGKFEWEPVGTGVVDWVGQLRALHAIGYRHGVSLETHWRGAGTPEASSRASMADLKKALVQAGIQC